MLPSETMIWQPEFTDKTLSRKPGAVHYRSKTQNGDVLIKAHPAAAMKADAWKRIRAMLAEFGMSPASRAKVNTAGPDNVDPLAELLKARD
ncbi:P27 family phage terminase small subunit [Escherichia coli]